MSELPPYPPVGVCIYCGKDKSEAKLTLEHIIPYGLNGDLLLPESSCNECAKITGKFEGVVQRTMWNPLRAYLNTNTRRPKERPTTYKVAKADRKTPIEEIDSSKFDYEVPIEQYNLIVMPGFSKPAWFEGKKGTEGFTALRFWLNNIGIPIARDAGAYTKKDFVDLDAFCKMLAKIAHAYAIAEIGYRKFEMWLPDIILSQEKRYGYTEPDLIGCYPRHSKKTSFNYISHKIKKVNGEIIIIVNIQLFAKYGAPMFR